jgi:hypothetical protein
VVFEHRAARLTFRPRATPARPVPPAEVSPDLEQRVRELAAGITAVTWNREHRSAAARAPAAPERWAPTGPAGSPTSATGWRRARA